MRGSAFEFPIGQRWFFTTGPASRPRSAVPGAAFIASVVLNALVFAELERLATSWAAFKSSRLMDVKWCHPKLVVEVKHLAGSKTLRHSTVKALAR